MVSLEFGVGVLTRLLLAVVVAFVVAALVALAARLFADALGVLDGFEADGFCFGADGVQIGHLCPRRQRVFREGRLRAWALAWLRADSSGRKQLGQPAL
jgi:hypothetical protein